MIASYHKVNRNPFVHASNVKETAQDVWWSPIDKVVASPFQNDNIYLTKESGVGTSYDTGRAIAEQKLGLNGFIEFQKPHFSNTDFSGSLAVGVFAKDSKSYSDSPFQVTLDWNISNQGSIRVVVGGGTPDHTIPNPTLNTTAWTPNERFRIVREGANLIFQRTSGSNYFKDFYSTTIPANLGEYTSFKVGAWLYHDGEAGYGRSRVANVKVSSGRYDNWYIRHTLPQSDLQYRWIDDSYNDDKNQPFGFTGLTHDGGGLVPFTIPSASTSMTQSSPTFLSESLTGAFGLNVDFVGLNSLIYSPITASTNTYGYPLSRPLASYAGSVLPL